MKPIATLTALVSLVVAAIPTSAGERFTSGELKFAIEFPATPQQQQGTQAVTSGEAQVFRFKSVGEKIRPSLSVIVFPREPFTDEEAAIGMKMSAARQVAFLNGSVVSERNLSVDGFAGRETVIRGESQGRIFFYRAQTFYVENRQFILSVAAEDLDGVTTAADGYFDSLSLWD